MFALPHASSRSHAAISFVNELARREDWRGLLAFSPESPELPKRNVITAMRNGTPGRVKKPGKGRKSCG
ncbi:hypothetical protein ACVXHA_29355 [Escherichia coli]